MKFDAEAAVIKFSLGDFKIEIEKICEVSEFSELLDNYQYQMCEYIANRAGDFTKADHHRKMQEIYRAMKEKQRRISPC
jgi:hypothetical protein